MKALSVILIAHNEEQAIGRMLEGLLANYDQEIVDIGIKLWKYRLCGLNIYFAPFLIATFFCLQ